MPEAASAIAEKFFNSPARTRGVAQGLPALLSVDNTPMASAFAEKLPESGIAWEMESIKLNDFFSRDTSAHFPSVITENARLAAPPRRRRKRGAFSKKCSVKIPL